MGGGAEMLINCLVSVTATELIGGAKTHVTYHVRHGKPFKLFSFLINL